MKEEIASSSFELRGTEICLLFLAFRESNYRNMKTDSKLTRIFFGFFFVTQCKITFKSSENQIFVEGGSDAVGFFPFRLICSPLNRQDISFPTISFSNSHVFPPPKQDLPARFLPY